MVVCASGTSPSRRPLEGNQPPSPLKRVWLASTRGGLQAHAPGLSPQASSWTSTSPAWGRGREAISQLDELALDVWPRGGCRCLTQPGQVTSAITITEAAIAALVLANRSYLHGLAHHTHAWPAGWFWFCWRVPSSRLGLRTACFGLWDVMTHAFCTTGLKACRSNAAGVGAQHAARTAPTKPWLATWDSQLKVRIVIAGGPGLRARSTAGKIQ